GAHPDGRAEPAVGGRTRTGAVVRHWVFRGAGAHASGPPAAQNAVSAASAVSGKWAESGLGIERNPDLPFLLSSTGTPDRGRSFARRSSHERGLPSESSAQR